MKLYSIVIKGIEHTWFFNVFLRPEDIEDYEEDGLEVYEMVNIIPTWVPSRLIRTWVFLQDLWHFKWLYHI